MPVRVKLDPNLLSRLRKVESAVLDDLAPLVQAHAASALQASKLLVPVGEQDTDGKTPLVTTGFVDGPVVNSERASARRPVTTTRTRAQSTRASTGA